MNKLTIRQLISFLLEVSGEYFVCANVVIGY
jgi:hypothetical protein